jgi:hypothetical protein
VSGTLAGHNPERVGSVPNIPLVVLNLISFEQRPELLLIRRPVVMFLLVCDVIAKSRDLREADREHAVAILPGELFQALALEPERRAALYLFDISDASQVRDSVESRWT